MVELGRRQAAENADFAARAATVATHLVVVGRTNRRALLAGASAAEPAPPGASDGASDGTARLAEVVVVPNREAAVAWVRENTAGGDAVLYENDLPDHYP
jgi:UDP-N-acetylmuramoyl-tripeptide--D-alanyl-D-alanine ligase